MKNRTPKYPGRVKMTPVAGQTNVYDMERADDPDDTGTPFNKRTMLQDSTGQFLKLPLANPFPDDALRHMVDRITPIGTIRTSPAQSLGDAWLKCDGSTVTFENYPQLCSVLRNTTGAVTWGVNNFPTTYTGISYASEPVYFAGKWIVAISSPAWVKILSASALDGEWAEEASIAETFQFAYRVFMSASENNCVCTFTEKYSGSRGYKLKILVKEKSATTWSEISNTVYSDMYDNGSCCGIANCGDRFAILFNYPGSSSTDAYQFILYSDSPAEAESWVETSKYYFADMLGYDRISCANKKWFIISQGTKMELYWADDDSLFNFNAQKSVLVPDAGDAITQNVSYFNGAYYLFSGITRYQKQSFVAKTSDLSNWEKIILADSFYTNINNYDYAFICANDSLLAIAAGQKIETTADPDNGFNATTIPSVEVTGLAIRGLTVVASSKAGIMYHDYTYDSRLLPTISLSDDTTTFIKAKNELDVFEAQQSGG